MSTSRTRDAVKRRNVAWNLERAEYLRDLLLELTHKEIKVRYKSSILGYLWSVLNPLSMALIYFFAFKVVVRMPMENYPIFLIAGLFPWQWLFNSAVGSASSYLSNASLIKKTAFPRAFIPLSIVLNDLFHFIMSLPISLAFLYLGGMHVSLALLYGLPILIIAQLCLTFGLSLLVASVNVFFRDLERLMMILLSFTFYLTPIVYPLDMVPVQYRGLVFLNPVTPLILAYQGLLLRGDFALLPVALALAWSVVFLSLGLLAYRRLRWRFAEAL